MSKRSRIDILITELEAKRNILNAQIDALRDAAAGPTGPAPKPRVRKIKFTPTQNQFAPV